MGSQGVCDQASRSCRGIRGPGHRARDRLPAAAPGSAGREQGCPLRSVRQCPEGPRRARPIRCLIPALPAASAWPGRAADADGPQRRVSGSRRASRGVPGRGGRPDGRAPVRPAHAIGSLARLLLRRRGRWAGSAVTGPGYDPVIQGERIALVDLLDRVLAGGVVIAGDITLSIAEVDLVRVSLRALVTSISGLMDAMDDSQEYS